MLKRPSSSKLISQKLLFKIISSYAIFIWLKQLVVLLLATSVIRYIVVVIQRKDSNSATTTNLQSFRGCVEKCIVWHSHSSRTYIHKYIHAYMHRCIMHSRRKRGFLDRGECEGDPRSALAAQSRVCRWQSLKIFKTNIEATPTGTGFTKSVERSRLLRSCSR